MIYHTFNPSIKRFPTWKAAPSSYALACEQALRGALAAGREKEGELATTSLKIEYVKVDGKCWLAEMTLVMTSLPLAHAFTCFSMVVYVRARLRFALISGNLAAQSTGSHRGIGGVIHIPETYLQALLPFPAPPPACSGELVRRLLTLNLKGLGHTICYSF